MTAQIIHITSATRRPPNFPQPYRQPARAANLPRASARGLRIGDRVEAVADRFRGQQGTICEFDISERLKIVMMIRVDFGHIRAWLSPNDLKKVVA